MIKCEIVILMIEFTLHYEKKHTKNVKCDVNVSVKIEKPNLLHDWSHGLDLKM